MPGEQKTQSILLFVAVGLTAVAVVLLIMIYASRSDDNERAMVASAKKLAGELSDNNLAEAAIDEYRRILASPSLTDGERGAVNYLIAQVYFDQLGDYQGAAAYYIRARSLDENASYAAEAGKNLITCFEKLGRRLDARRELDQQTSPEPDTSRVTGKLVAKVGNRSITAAEFNQAMQSLPREMQDKLASREEKRKFLDQVIGRELIYHAALREGMDRETAVQNDLREIEKEYLVQHYTQLKIAPTVRPDTAELTLYFNANKTRYGDKKLEEIRDQVTQEYIAYIGQKAINDYISQLLRAEPVQVFEENIK